MFRQKSLEFREHLIRKLFLVACKRPNAVAELAHYALHMLVLVIRERLGPGCKLFDHPIVLRRRSLLPIVG